MKEESKKIIEAINRGGLDPTIWQMVCFSCATLVAVATVTPEIDPYVKEIVGRLIDGNILLKDSLRDGILPKSSKA